MDFDNAKLLLFDYLNGHLEGEELEMLEKALEADPALRAECDSMKTEISLLKNSLNDPFEDVHLTNINESVMGKIRKRKVIPISDFSPAWRSYIRAAAALIVIIIGITIFFQLSPGGFVKENTATYVEHVERRGAEETTSPALESNSDSLNNYSESLNNGSETLNDDDELKVVRLSLATSDPKIKIYWTMSSDFKPLTQED